MDDHAVLQELGQLAAASLGRADKARALAEAIRRARGYRWVGLYDVGATEIAAIAWTGNEAPAFPRFPRASGLNGAAVRDRAPVVVQDVTQDARWLTTFGSTRAEAIFPVQREPGGPVVGTIDVESDRTDAFTLADRAFLAAAAEVLRAFWSAEGT